MTATTDVSVADMIASIEDANDEIAKLQGWAIRRRGLIAARDYILAAEQRIAELTERAKKPIIGRNGLREQLAALCHEQWSGWMKYQFERMIFADDLDSIPRLIKADDFHRWRLQARTPYANLTEKEKESDRKEADRFLALLMGR